MSSSAEVRETLLRSVKMPVLLVVTERVQRSCSKDADDRTEYIRLLVVEIDQVNQLTLDVINGPSNRSRFESRREWNVVIKVLSLCHSR